TTPTAQARGIRATDIKAETLVTNEKDRAELRRDPEVVGTAPVMPVHLVVPPDTAVASAGAGPAGSWGVEAGGGLDSPRTGAGVRVAVLDTGIDPNHPAFAGISLTPINCKNFTNEGDEDINGHGTHCAGTIFGRDVDGKRIGIARGVTEVFIGKVLG